MRHTIVGERTSIDLPLPSPKDSKNPTIDLALAYDPVTGAGVVGIENELKTFVDEPTAKPVELVLSAGGSAPWAQDLMEVLLLTDDASASNVAGIGGVRNSAKNSATDKIKAALDKLLTQTDGSDALVHAAGRSGGTASVSNLVSTLEVYTPPAVRHGRPDSVRTLVAKGQGK